eukprot:764046-Hanusia_phi.AAC.14
MPNASMAASAVPSMSWASSRQVPRRGRVNSAPDMNLSPGVSSDPQEVGRILSNAQAQKWGRDWPELFDQIPGSEMYMGTGTFEVDEDFHFFLDLDDLLYRQRAARLAKQQAAASSMNRQNRLTNDLQPNVNLAQLQGTEESELKPNDVASATKHGLDEGEYDSQLLAACGSRMLSENEECVDGGAVSAYVAGDLDWQIRKEGLSDATALEEETSHRLGQLPDADDQVASLGNSSAWMIEANSSRLQQNTQVSNQHLETANALDEEQRQLESDMPEALSGNEALKPDAHQDMHEDSDTYHSERNGFAPRFDPRAMNGVHDAQNSDQSLEMPSEKKSEELTKRAGGAVGYWMMDEMDQSPNGSNIVKDIPLAKLKPTPPPHPNTVSVNLSQLSSGSSLSGKSPADIGKMQSSNQEGFKNDQALDYLVFNCEPGSESTGEREYLNESEGKSGTHMLTDALLGRLLN